MKAKNIPDSPAALEESLSDPAKLKDLWENPKDLQGFIQGYAEKFAKRDRGEVDAQIREQAQLAVADMLQAERKEAPPVTLNGHGRPAIAGDTGAQVALYNKYAPGVKMEGVFADAAEVFQAAAVGRVNFGSGRDKELAAKRAKAMEIMNAFGSEVPADGGFLIPEVLRSQLLAVALEQAIIRPRATVIPMDSLRVPIPMIDDTSHVTNVFGGIQGYWTEESAALTASQASFGRVVLDAKKLTAYAVIPNELIQDAPAFNGFLSAKMPVALAYFEDAAFFNGTGVGEPMGFINCAASVNVAKESGQAAATILWENIVKQYARMLPTSLANAVWVANLETFPQLATMALSVGTAGSAVWLGNLQYPGSGGPPVSILGRPVYFTEKTSALGSPGDIAFVDLSYYLIGDRMSMQAMTSEHYLFANDQLAYRVIERVDGRPWIQSAITPRLGSSSLTPFVQIATR